MRTPERIGVLLVDDQRFVGAALARLLANEKDIELHCCHEPLDAVTRANLLRPAVILQDLIMPEIDGLTLVGLFRKNAATAATPIIVLSGDDDRTVRARAEAAGANGYLLKLPAKELLLASIREHAVRGGTPQAAASDDVFDSNVIDAMKPSPDAAIPDFALDLIDQFNEEATRRVQDLQRAADRGDVAALKAAAHSLKGSALVMGASRLGRMCGRLEAHVERHPDGQGASTLVAAFPEELAQLRRAFADFRQGTR